MCHTVKRRISGESR